MIFHIIYNMQFEDLYIFIKKITTLIILLNYYSYIITFCCINISLYLMERCTMYVHVIYTRH